MRKTTFESPFKEAFAGVSEMRVSGDIPDQFTIVDQTGVALSTVTTSAVVNVTGLTANSIISISGGTYQLNGVGGFISTPSTFTPGDTFEARKTSSDQLLTTVTCRVFIGGVSEAFNITTVPV